MAINKFNFAELHMAVWLWSSKYPKKDRDDWPEWRRNGGALPPIENDCFACEATLYNIKLTCKKCPLQWSDGLICTDKGSPYQVYDNFLETENYPEASKAAYKIAHLEWIGQKIFNLDVQEHTGTKALIVKAHRQRVQVFIDMT